MGSTSASQFSREYSRFLGNAPAKDIARLRTLAAAPTGLASRAVFIVNQLHGSART